MFTKIITANNTVSIISSSAISLKAANVLKRVIDQKAMPMGGECHEEYKFKCSIYLDLDNTLPAEGFKIQKTSDEEIHIIGGDYNGILYGCGKLLRISDINPDKIIFGEHPEISKPEKSNRGMYFAVHNYNVYQVAPADFIEQYIEDLALWGINNIAVVFHKFHFTGISDSHIKEYLERLNFILTTAKSLGMKATLLITANDGYANSPVDLRYKGKTPRNWGTEICISNPKGLDLVKNEFEEMLNVLTPIDQLVIWSYDSGGCNCNKCSPWGIKGYIQVSSELCKIFKDKYPKGHFYLSTWYFDYNCGNIGEWNSLFEKLDNGELDWCDGILADGAYVNDFFPRQVIEHKINKPVISFMEISMLTGRPWGGYGSNPVPKFIQEQWDISKNSIIGGIPYSEGIYEDINKIIWAQLCWSPDRQTVDILKEYVEYEFSREYASEIAAAIEALEASRIRAEKAMVTNFSNSARTWEEFSFYDRCLVWNARNSWRWKQNLLRAKLDAEMAHSKGNATAEMGRIFDELFNIYHLTDRSFKNVRPEDVISDPESGKKALKFNVRGKSLLDFCSYRNTAHEDTL